MSKKSLRGTVFPLVEVFGYPHASPEARAAQVEKWCPFAENECEKFRQYGFGYCSVPYSAEADGNEMYIYAVCDHRLDGAPVRVAIRDHFGNRSDVHLVAEVQLRQPKTSNDYVAFTRDSSGEIDDAVVIETQAIDIRGGGVGPAFEAWMNSAPDDWRAYFTAEAERKGRRDTVDYGVNMGNIYKRLGLQLANKGAYLRDIGVPLYVVMQDRPFRYLRKRIPFAEAREGDPWDVTFVTFEYEGGQDGAGHLKFGQKDLVRATLESYLDALTVNPRTDTGERERFLKAVRRKAGLS